MSYLELQINQMDSNSSLRLKEYLQDWGESFLGIEEYSLDESQVDDLLGERSYSGGNLPTEVIDEVDENSSEAYTFKIFFAATAKEDVEKLMQFIKESLHYESLLFEKEDQDWNEEWKKHYTAIPILDEMVVVPVWEKSLYSHVKFPIFIYPGMGFGTGSHETTALCLMLFMKYASERLDIKNVMDFGSGSGILALGAKRVFPKVHLSLVDIDQAAHENAQINFSENDFSLENTEFLFPDQVDASGKYQIVFANILQNILFEERNRLVELMDDDGILILSGLLKDQLVSTTHFYQEITSLALIETEIKNDWGAIIFKKIKR